MTTARPAKRYQDLTVRFFDRIEELTDFSQNGNTNKQRVIYAQSNWDTRKHDDVFSKDSAKTIEEIKNNMWDDVERRNEYYTLACYKRGTSFDKMTKGGKIVTIKPRRIKNIHNFFAVGVDIDMKKHFVNLDPDKAELLAELIAKNIPDEVSVSDFVCSGRGMHAIWMFDRTLIGTQHKKYNELARWLFDVIKKAIEDAGLDQILEACTPITANHLLRIPGTRNSTSDTFAAVVWSDENNVHNFFDMYNFLREENNPHVTLMRKGETVFLDGDIMALVKAGKLDRVKAKKYMKKIPISVRGTTTEAKLIGYINNSWDRKKVEVKHAHDSQAIFEDFSYLAKNGIVCEGYRNKLVFSIALYTMQDTDDVKLAEERAEKLNDSFKVGLSVSEVRLAVNSAFKYAQTHEKLFPMSSIIRFNGIENEVFEETENGHVFKALYVGYKTKKQYNRELSERRKKARAFAKRRDKKVAIVDAMRREHRTLREIAQEIRMSIRTVSRYVVMLKEREMKKKANVYNNKPTALCENGMVSGNVFINREIDKNSRLNQDNTSGVEGFPKTDVVQMTIFDPVGREDCGISAESATTCDRGLVYETSYDEGCSFVMEDGFFRCPLSLAKNTKR